MPYYLIHAGTKLQKMATDGSLADLALPSGVTISDDRPARFALLNKTILVANAPSRTLLFDGGLNAHLASLAAPTAAPTVSAGSGSLIGDYVVAYTFAIKDANGNVIAESDLSPLSASITLATEGLALSSIQQSSMAGVTTRRIYRSASGGNALYWAYDLEGNGATTYTSTELDVALDTVAMSEAGLGAAPGATDVDRLKLVVAWKDRLWGVSDIEPDNLRFSGARKPYAWDPFNMIPVPPIGADLIGVNGFLPRRDELGVLKLNLLAKVIGSNPDDFELIVVAEGVGSYGPDTNIVIRDVGYFLSHDGVYTWGPEGVNSISDADVRPWFTTDLYFNRSAFSTAFARYNWRTHSFELHLPSAGQTDIDQWVQYDIDRKRWFGPHESLAMVPTSGGQITDDYGLPVPAVGSEAGFLWTQNNLAVMDGEFEIVFDVETQPYTEAAADIDKLFKELSLLTRDEGGGFVQITPTVDKDEQTMFLAPLGQTRTRLRRLGNGRLLTLRFVHDTLEEDCEIHGFEVPFHATGRR
jgi:hypothetical protein